MAELITLARPYARAAFEVARADQELGLWAEGLELAAAVTESDKVRALFDTPALTAQQKSQKLLEVLGFSEHAKFSNFIKTLAYNQRLPLLVHIWPFFKAFKAQQEKTVDVEVRSAISVSEALQSKLTEALTRKLQREVKLHTEIDESLLGGALIRAGDTVIDGSVSGRLAKLAESMKA